MTGQERLNAFLRQLPPNNAPEQPQRRYPLSVTDSLLMGRDPRCQIVFDPLIYRSVSRCHAAVSPIIGFETSDGSQFWQVCDRNSANGTFVNGAQIQGCQVLQVGDRIMLGQNGPELIFECQLVSELSTKEPPLPTVPPLGTTGNIRLPTVPRRVSMAATAQPVPRSPNQASPRYTGEPVSLTQLFPILSTGRELSRKAYLLPGSITVALVVMLFLTMGTPPLFNSLLAAYLSGAAYYFVYQLCGKHKPWWLLVGASMITIALLLSPALDGFIWLFRQVLPGRLPAANETVGFPALLIRMFFGAGLMEELLKAVPVLLVFACGTQLRSPQRERLGVWEPLDGILLGCASAVGFTLVETLGQYVPEIYQATIKAGEGAAQLASLQLLIPRVLGSVAGHMAYSGYFGYFIGLSVLRSRQRWLVLGVGYLTASALHALWNAAGSISPVMLALVGLLSYAFLAAAILKARTLSPMRSQNFATRLHR